MPVAISHRSAYKNSNKRALAVNKVMATIDTAYQSSVVSGREKKRHCSKIRKIQSRGVFLVLLWTLGVYATGPVVFKLASNYFDSWLLKNEYILPIIVILLFCPLAGWLADVRFGRYKILKVSLWFAWISTAGLVILCTLSIAGISIPSAVMKAASVLIILPISFSCASFWANGIPFAMDQMPAASGEQMNALINWYIWASYLGGAVAQLGAIPDSDNNQMVVSETQTFVLIGVLAILTIAISCGMILHSDLIIEPQSQNPWKTVFIVLKYAATHKHPENRSAFTYCEDPPSRMDLGKNRYGGPYTTEEVEDVKTFLRIMTVILSLSVSSISFFLCTFSNSRILKGAEYLNTYSYNAVQFSYSVSVLICLYIPLYEFVIYPFVRNRIPSMLKRIVISAFGVIIMSIYLLTIDIAGHYSSGQNITCIFNDTEDIEMLPVNFAVLSVPFQIILSSVYLLLLTSIFQFICAQTPYSMKGLLIGSAFLVVYFSWCIADVVLGGVHNKWKHRYYSVISRTTSCDFWFFITTLMISIAGLVIVSLAAKWYKKREREDPHNDRMFVEIYYDRYCVNPSTLDEA